MTDSLKAKTVHGVVWSALERFSLQGVQFVINIVMARLLLPADYGIVGMLTVFLQVSQAFIDGGFTNALIQRKDRDEIDYSTVFYFNIVISVFFYLLLFICAPWIAEFYHMPALVSVTRILALNLIIVSLSAVHRTKLTIDIDFKTQSKASLTAICISGGIGIIMAYKGYGSWALVFQSILNSLFLTGLLYYFIKWKPLKVFSFYSFKRLFNFGSKLLMSSLLHTVYRNLYALVIGRKFSAVDLGYYTRADQFATFPSANLNAIIMRVTFPVLSSIQDDDERLRHIYRKYIQLASYLIFPLMIGLAALAKPTVELLLTAKWSGVVILLQILCFDFIFDHLSGINLNLLYVKGHSDWALRLEIIKKSIATLILFISISGGLVGMCAGRVIYSLIAVYLNSFYTKRLIGISLWTQIKDILPCFLLAFLMGVIILGISNLLYSNVLKLCVGIITGIISYFLFSYLFKVNLYKEFFFLLKIGKV